MSQAHIIHPVEFAAFGIINFAKSLSGMIKNSTHSHEQAVYRLLSDLELLSEEQTLDTGSYHAILGKSADVAEFFNIDVMHMADDTNHWYRASIIHQMGLGMLQAIERIRPDLTTLPFFSDAIACLSQRKQNDGPSTKNGGPLSSRCWANNLPFKS